MPVVEVEDVGQAAVDPHGLQRRTTEEGEPRRVVRVVPGGFPVVARRPVE